ncbi:hypothetical protein IJU97_02935 [bacterium]|nr:hypothetical protein [bacterium]
MKKQTYLEFIQTLLPKEEFLAFKECYQSRIPKSIKIIQSRIDKDYFFKIASELNRTLVAPQLSNGEEKYDDVLFLKKEDKTTL